MPAPVLTSYRNGIGQVSGDQLDTFEQTCDTFEQLRAFVGTTGIQVSARGRTAPADGYGGDFWWNPGSTAPDDNLNVIVPYGALVGAWQRLPTAGATFNFNAEFLVWWAGLPTTLPATAGVPWNNGGSLSVS